MPQTLSADCVFHCVLHHCLHLALVTLELLVLPRIALGDLLQPNDAISKALLKLLRVGAIDGLRDVDERQQAVRRRRHGRELGVVSTDALVHVRHERDGLAGPQLGDQNVRVGGRDGQVARKVLFLLANGDELEVACVDVGGAVQLPRVRLAGGGVRVACALDVELELDRVVVHAVGKRILVRAGLLVPFHPLMDSCLGALERDQPQAVAQDLILDDGRVVVNPHVLNGQRGDFGDQDAAEGVGDGGVDADQREGGVVLAVLVEDDTELRAEDIQVPGMVFAGVVAGEVG